MEFNLESALVHYEKEQNITEAARRHCKDLGIPYEEKYRLRMSRYLNSDKAEDPDLDNLTNTNTNQYLSENPLSALKADGTIMSISEYCKHYKIPEEDVRTYKLVTHTGKGAYYNIASNVVKGEGLEKFFRDMVSEIENISTRPSTIFRLPDTDDNAHLLVVDPADIHIGKLCDSFEVGEDYNSQIAVKRVKEGVEGILEKAKGFKIDKILFIGGNDVLHIDTPKRTTTSGTFQDTDGMWYRNFLTAKQLYIELLDRLLMVADVHFMYNPSNHDYVNGFFLADVIQTYYKDVENITFDCSISHRKYYTYGNNLIGTTHGDGAKVADLPMLMAQESKDWSSTKHRYIYTHHVHHKNAKDYIGVTVESLRSPSPADSWHHRNGYQHNPLAVEGFVHSKKYGQISRITHIF